MNSWYVTERIPKDAPARKCSCCGEPARYMETHMFRWGIAGEWKGVERGLSEFYCFDCGPLSGYQNDVLEAAMKEAEALACSP